MGEPLTRQSEGEAEQFSPPPSERELVVIVASDARIRASEDGITSLAGADISGLAEVLGAENLALVPLFGMSEEQQVAKASLLAARGAEDVPDLSVYYRVRAEESRLEELAERLRAEPVVEAAYVKPGAEPASVPAVTAPDEVAPAATPDFVGRQGYLGPSPAGINALWSLGQAGGDGAGVHVIDVEGAWQFGHEDLLQNTGGVIVGTPINDLSWRNHGTAVLGEFSADRNGFGVLGIGSGAVVRGASIFGGPGSANAIRQAADHLNAGDIVLIELHQPGPRFSFQNRPDQRGYIAIEWFPDNLAAIRYARARGVIVVEAAGNGAENLDDPLYDQRPVGFPASWRNPFNPANPSSGAVIVGAGAPPPGTHGRDHGPDRSRLGFSNFGRRVDAQGWGREVTTTGGRGGQAGDLQGGIDETVWYTDMFSGTSSASPIVVGALACIQGILKARGLPLLTPVKAIKTLRATGSPQQDGPGRPASQRIGNRPDIAAAITFLSPAATILSHLHEEVSLTMTSPPVNRGNGARVAAAEGAAGQVATSPMTAGFASAAIEAAAVTAGIATQYWDEAVPYPAGNPPRLWLFVDGAYRALSNPGPSNRDMVQRAFLFTDSTVRVWYDGTTVVGLVISGT